KTAWRMFRQIRSLLSEPEMQLEGDGVEMDESYFGPKRKRGGKRGRPSADSPKQCVVGIVERQGRAIALTAENTTNQNLFKISKEPILPEAPLFTDYSVRSNTF